MAKTDGAGPKGRFSGERDQVPAVRDRVQGRRVGVRRHRAAGARRGVRPCRGRSARNSWKRSASRRWSWRWPRPATRPRPTFPRASSASRNWRPRPRRRLRSATPRSRSCRGGFPHSTGRSTWRRSWRPRRRRTPPKTSCAPSSGSADELRMTCEQAKAENERLRAQHQAVRREAEGQRRAHRGPRARDRAHPRHEGEAVREDARRKPGAALRGGVQPAARHGVPPRAVQQGQRRERRHEGRLHLPRVQRRGRGSGLHHVRDEERGRRVGPPQAQRGPLQEASTRTAATRAANTPCS